MDSVCIAEVCSYQSISFISQKKLNKLKSKVILTPIFYISR